MIYLYVVHILICIYLSIYLSLSIHVCVCIYIYIYTYAHTYGCSDQGAAGVRGPLHGPDPSRDSDGPRASQRWARDII